MDEGVEVVEHSRTADIVDRVCIICKRIKRIALFTITEMDRVSNWIHELFMSKKWLQFATHEELYSLNECMKESRAALCTPKVVDAFLLYESNTKDYFC